jgi:NADP-dependent 3-hydroxy acid dehydrogenase YdfG
MTDNPLQPEDLSATVMHVLESPANHLISELVVRPLRPRG